MHAAAADVMLLLKTDVMLLLSDVILLLMYADDGVMLRCC